MFKVSKSIIFLLVALLLLTMPVSSAMAAGEDENLSLGANITGALNTTTGVLTITGTGNMNNYRPGTQDSPTLAYAAVIKKVIIGDGITSIGQNSFRLCNKITSVSIPNTVTLIDTGAFGECTSLTSITIPASVTSINTAFTGCTSLTNIEVAAGNTVYSSISGVIYDKTETTLVSCTVGKTGTLSIPSSVTSIANSAFIGCTNLTGIVIPDSVASIGNYALNGCTNLAFIINEYDGMQTIGANAFNNAGSAVSAANRKAYASPTNTTFVDAMTTAGYTVKGLPNTVPVEGTIDATLISVTHPASVEYAIYPNLGYEAGAFIAPDIAVTNNTIVPVRVTVKSLTSAGGVGDFTDAAPSAHDWENLNTTDSKTYIALGLQIPTGGAGWNAGYEDEAKYAVDISDTPMGMLAATATGHITMLAKYGLAFDQGITAHHNLLLMFDLV